ncbi:unnamed protein product [Tenebrio molitor]|nr:unnamed protein product [Tenebrio molitor]
MTGGGRTNVAPNSNLEDQNWRISLTSKLGIYWTKNRLFRTCKLVTQVQIKIYCI